MSGRFDGRNAVVTGASRGIGAAIAERLAAEGANVAITARTVDKHDHLAGSLNETMERCARFGTTITAIGADLADPTDRARIIPEAVAALGGDIDLLVNNAAAGIHMQMADFPHKRRRIMFEVNFEAPMDLAQAALPAMRAKGEGWIVNLSSGSANLKSGPPFDVGAMGTSAGIYGATKAALNRMTNALGAELYGAGIRVNTLQPYKPVASEGAVAHLQDRLAADAYVPVEIIVQACVELLSCPPERTARVHIDRDLLDEIGATVMTLDGTAPLVSI
jgi:NAD(P)-dependent dehydrogenase (short-subunit alcohol dehydrogenase family)